MLLGDMEASYIKASPSLKELAKIYAKDLFDLKIGALPDLTIYPKAMPPLNNILLRELPRTLFQVRLLFFPCFTAILLKSLLFFPSTAAPHFILFYFTLLYFTLFYFILLYFIWFHLILFYYFIILLFYYFIILLFYYFIILLFYYFIILLFYYFIILLFYFNYFIYLFSVIVIYNFIGPAKVG